MRSAGTHFVVAALALLSVAAPAQRRDQTQNTCPEQPDGALNVRLYPVGERMVPPAELLLTDPRGRRIGMDPAARKNYLEIPNASYEFEGIDDDETGEPGPSTAIADIWCSPESGGYTVEVIGTAAGQYELEVLGFDVKFQSSSRQFGPLAIAAGERHKYAIEYAKAVGSQVRVRRMQPPAAKR